MSLQSLTCVTSSSSSRRNEDPTRLILMPYLPHERDISCQQLQYLCSHVPINSRTSGNSSCCEKYTCMHYGERRQAANYIVQLLVVIRKRFHDQVQQNGRIFASIEREPRGFESITVMAVLSRGRLILPKQLHSCADTAKCILIMIKRCGHCNCLVCCKSYSILTQFARKQMKMRSSLYRPSANLAFTLGAFGHCDQRSAANQFFDQQHKLLQVMFHLRQYNLQQDLMFPIIWRCGRHHLDAHCTKTLQTQTNSVSKTNSIFLQTSRNFSTFIDTWPSKMPSHMR